MYGRDIVAPPGNQVATENTNLCLQHWESPVYSKIGHVRICGGDGQEIGRLYPEVATPLAEEEQRLVLRQGLFVMRETYQRLNDAKLLPPSIARKLEYEADDLIDAAGLGLKLTSDQPPWYRKPAHIDWLAIRVLGWLPDPLATTPEEGDYAELSAHHIAAFQAIASIDLLRSLPNFRDEVCTQVIDLLHAWGDAAQTELVRLEQQMSPEVRHIQRRYASAIGSFASASALHELVDAGVLPEAVAERATTEVIQSMLNVPRQAPERRV